MPLRLMSFRCDLTPAPLQRRGVNVTLNWQTTNEENVSHFDVERSDDGKDWSKAKSEKSKGGSGNNEYSVIDDSPLEGVNYYRLKMVDRDGRFSYSPVRSVVISNYEEVSVYPNPAADHITLKGSNIKQVEIVNAYGATVLSKKVNPGGTTISLQNLSSGMYFVKITDANRIVTVRKVFKKL